MNKKLSPKYSICMINLNMAGTLRRSVESVASQLNEEFEIVLLDGGSDDGSQEEIRKLCEDYFFITPVFLKRDRSRKIGMDRNISAEVAKGRYLLFNIDCDDFYEAHIADWVKCFHLIEESNTEFLDGVLVSGAHINMISSRFFSALGGYKNVVFEDRDLWMRAASVGRWVNWNHRNFVERLPRTRSQWFYKGLIAPYHAALIDYHHRLKMTDAIRLAALDLKHYQNYKLMKLLYIFLVRVVPNKIGFDNDIIFNPISFSFYSKKIFYTLIQLVGESNCLEITFHNSKSKEIFLNL